MAQLKMIFNSADTPLPAKVKTLPGAPAAGHSGKTEIRTPEKFYGLAG